MQKTAKKRVEAERSGVISRKEVGAGSYQPRDMISKHRNPKKDAANIKFPLIKSKFLTLNIAFLTFLGDIFDNLMICDIAGMKHHGHLHAPWPRKVRGDYFVFNGRSDAPPTNYSPKREWGIHSGMSN